MNPNIKGTAGSKTGPSQFATLGTSNPALLLDKLHARRSTPDSEALASSDDEADGHRHEHYIVPAQMHKPTRRASWLNDISAPLSQPRKGSFASSSMSPTTSHPSTPSAESGTTWGAHATPASVSGPSHARGTAGPNSFPWGAGIWNPDAARKEPPSRLSEVLPSPTSSRGNSQQFTRRESQEQPIPFAIPLHPTPKTYRSQSYSVGQLDPDSNTPTANPPGAPPNFGGRGRMLPHPSGLHHRPSRPSMLSEVSNDGTGLGNVKEVEDDDEDPQGSDESKGARIQMDQAKAIEELARENAILRQQQYNSERLRSRSSAANPPYAVGNAYVLRDGLPDGSDYAIDELDELSELQELSNRGLLGRRMSEYSQGQTQKQTYNTLENRKLESVKKAYWQSSLDFGGLSDIPQSRRHSFADVPTRHGSVGSINDDGRGRENGLDASTTFSDPNYAIGEHEHPQFSDPSFASRFGQSSIVGTAEDSMRALYSQQRSSAANYFGGPPAQAQNPNAFMAPNAMSGYNAYGMAPQYQQPRPASPHRAMYGLPQPRHNQLLYIVLFKCSRADVFYVQEGTGLSVKPGDLVIVEADRGTDLGTVAQDNVDWTQAKELKEHYAEEHYKWLMMYSQGAAGTADGTGAGLMAASNGIAGSAVGGMGPPTQHGMQEPPSGEIKPKIIKRLAQTHEIQSLRDKEGNEAKAKRVCMQKVKEHGLHMEILDAEFQMDWKKLTFYYFADAYINFNSLVTDLFKVYKTRIWMSAINPASFASPSLGLQAPSGIGPGAIGINRAPQAERRPQQQEAQPAYSGIAQQPVRAFGGSGGLGFPSQQVPSERTQMPPSQFQQTQNFGYGYSAFGQAAPRAGTGSAGGFASGMIQPNPMDAYNSFAPQADYQQTQRFVQSQGLPEDIIGGEFARSANGLVGGGSLSGFPVGSDAWMNAMQALSLNSR